jgi:hypothetical protein
VATAQLDRAPSGHSTILTKNFVLFSFTQLSSRVGPSYLPAKPKPKTCRMFTLLFRELWQLRER